MSENKSVSLPLRREFCQKFTSLKRYTEYEKYQILTGKSFPVCEKCYEDERDYK